MGILKKGDTEIKLAIRGDEKDMLQARVDSNNSCAYLFYNYKGRDLSHINKLDTSRVTNMEQMFGLCTYMQQVDVSNFDTSNVETMLDMFNGCNALIDLDVSNFDMSNVKSISRIFEGCRQLTRLDLSNWDSSKVTTTAGVFKGCRSLAGSVGLNGTAIKLGPNFNTGNSSTFMTMFSECENITEIDCTCFDTSNAISLQAMFTSCKKLTRLDLSSFNTSKVDDMDYMFRYCENLTEIILGNIDTSNVTAMADLFRGCFALTTVSGTLDMIKVTSLSNMFSDCKALISFTLKNIKKSLQIGSGTTYGTLLDDPTIINTAKELWDLIGATSQVLTVSTPTNAKLDTIYVKLITATDEMIATDPNINSKKPCEVCDSTDEGAMTLREYIISKNWTISR